MVHLYLTTGEAVVVLFWGTTHRKSRLTTNQDGRAGGLGAGASSVEYGMTESALTVTRSRKVRIFKKLETLVRYLKDLGLSRLDVNAANYDPAGGRVLT